MSVQIPLRRSPTQRQKLTMYAITGNFFILTFTW